MDRREAREMREEVYGQERREERGWKKKWIVQWARERKRKGSGSKLSREERGWDRRKGQEEGEETKGRDGEGSRGMEGREEGIEGQGWVSVYIMM